MRSSILHRRSAAGFTLIELMVTIAIAAVLGTIAVSSYSSQVRKSRRTEARQALLDLASREERFFSTNSSYTNAAGNLGYLNPFPQAVGNGYYQISVCVAAAAPCAGNATTGNVFAITATAISTQAKDVGCATFTLTSVGAQSAKDSGGADQSAICWR